MLVLANKMFDSPPVFACGLACLDSLGSNQEDGFFFSNPGHLFFDFSHLRCEKHPRYAQDDGEDTANFHDVILVWYVLVAVATIYNLWYGCMLSMICYVWLIYIISDMIWCDLWAQWKYNPPFTIKFNPHIETFIYQVPMPFISCVNEILIKLAKYRLFSLISFFCNCSA